MTTLLNFNEKFIGSLDYDDILVYKMEQYKFNNNRAIKAAELGIPLRKIRQI